MGANTIFVCALLVLVVGNLVFGFRFLPGERWQVLAALPGSKRNAGGSWQATNLTWYGLLTANAYAAALALLFVLLQSLGLSMVRVVLLAGILLALCIPAAGIIARWVEGKAYTLTVGGAVFVGFLVAPLGIALVNGIPLGEKPPLPLLPTLAAIAIAYALGEGMGRLACISFGCCYGKTLAQCPRWMSMLLGRWSFTFQGEMKKIAYASGLQGQPVVPIQAMTAVLYCGVALLGTFWFLNGNFALAFLATVSLTQIWRAVSEMLRADHRGGGRLSAYQWMALALVPCAAGLVWMGGGEQNLAPQVLQGLAVLWRTDVLLTLQGLWMLIFLHTGRSKTTGAELFFHVHRERI
ncbi:prolipoprotein diacylglyceryl transferase family protein [Geoalkalibacter halelectricus]|uniref:Prolipoprotein diacylglyceryl transferase n=1 Tax=Geoalkalibacter halelectricus TaxID=2847045 RepID=A0ABY5ZHN5_9BACT|nr:prolipoprotein diacylglyceryl transferase family protein [Geoalkalibacter halelectricus]MDO3376628.1 prolipoprotein diacylglyceryl transferase [Geoalkalibacter halelectricus]UWZ78414.1 prolipoprotein diacylglyceryl transferase [Geoalkalibacter halelectricus]